MILSEEGTTIIFFNNLLVCWYGDSAIRDMVVWDAIVAKVKHFLSLSSSFDISIA